MSKVLSNSQFQQLDAIAQTAKGSWYCERKRGGSGYMGSFVDLATGQTHYVKFAIHGDERTNLATDLKQGGYGEKLKPLSESLLRDLADLAKQVGVSDKFDKLLQDRDTKFPDLLTRKFVAKSVSLIADAHNDNLAKLKSGDVPTFSWKNVARLKAEDDTSLSSVYDDVKKLSETRSKELRSTVSHDFSTAGARIDEQVNSAFKAWEKEGFDIWSDHIKTIKMGLDKNILPDAWERFLPKGLPANHQKDLTLGAYQSKIIEKLCDGNSHRVLNEILNAVVKFRQENKPILLLDKIGELIGTAQRQVDLEVVNKDSRAENEKPVQENEQLPIELKGDQGLFEILELLNNKGVWPHIVDNPEYERQLEDLKDLLQTYKNTNEILGEIEERLSNKGGQGKNGMGIAEIKQQIRSVDVQKTALAYKLETLIQEAKRLRQEDLSCTDTTRKQKIKEKLLQKEREAKIATTHFNEWEDYALALQEMLKSKSGEEEAPKVKKGNLTEEEIKARREQRRKDAELQKKVGALTKHLNKRYFPGEFTEAYVENGLIHGGLVEKLKECKKKMQGKAFDVIKGFQREEMVLRRSDLQQKAQLEEEITRLESKIGKDFNVDEQEFLVKYLEYVEMRVSRDPDVRDLGDALQFTSKELLHYRFSTEEHGQKIEDLKNELKDLEEKKKQAKESETEVINSSINYVRNGIAIMEDPSKTMDRLPDKIFRTDAVSEKFVQEEKQRLADYRTLAERRKELAEVNLRLNGLQFEQQAS